jgi:CheY-like chemotaxis protein
MIKGCHWGKDSKEINNVERFSAMSPQPKNISMEDYLKGINSSRPPENIQILIAEDDDSLREIIQDFLKNPQRIISSFKNGQEAIHAIRKSHFDLVITDLMMPGADGMEVLRQAKGKNPDCVVILITGYASLDSALQAIRGGAYDYIRKPFKLDELEIVVKNACEKIMLVRENKGLLQRLKETMDEVRRLEIPPGKKPISPYEPFPVPNNRKISEMDVLLNQMAPPKYEIPQQEPHEKTIEDLEKLIQLRKDGFIDSLEFYSLKKALLEPIRD